MHVNEKNELRPHLHAAVFSGGGSKIMIQLKALQQLLLREPFYNPFLLAGNSCGALVAAILGQASASPKAFAKKVLDLHKILTSLKGNQSIWKRRFGMLRLVNMLAGYFLRGIWDTSPLEMLIKQNVNQKELVMSPRDVFVGAYHLNTLTYVEQGKHNSQILKWILASASFPVFFPPVEIGWNDIHGKPERYADGGIANMVPSESVLRLRPSRIDIFLTSSVTKKKGFWVDVDRLDDVALQTIMGIYGEITEEDLEPYFRYQERYPEAIINIHAPDPYQEVNGLDFSPDTLQHLYETVGSTVKEYSLPDAEALAVLKNRSSYPRPTLLPSESSHQGMPPSVN